MIEELLEYATRMFDLTKPDQAGVSRLQHFEHVAKAQGVPVESFTGKLTPPPELEWVWGVFLELDMARGSGGMGPAPISFSDIWCWCQLNRARLDRLEVRIIKQLDAIRLKAAYGRPSRTQSANQ